MAYKTQRKIHIGKNSTHTYFGLIGCSHGASWGGYDNYWYGIKGIVSFQIYKGWGECANLKL